MKCLLIGGAGFIGSWLTKSLIDQGHSVTIIDPLFDYGTDPNHVKRVYDFRKKELLQKATLFKGTFEDIGESIIKKVKPQVCVHLAGYPLELPYDSPFSLKQISEDTALTYKIVSTVKRHKIKKFIFLSSIAPFGHAPFTVNETTPIKPITVYGISKASGEFLTTSHLKNWVIVRSTNVYGFGDIHKRVINTMINSALQKEKSWINENAWLDFIYVKDLVEGITKVITSAQTQDIFHISGGKAHKLSDFIKFLEPYFPLKYDIKHLNDKPIRGTMDNSKARMILGWTPKRSLEAGIKDYVRYIKKYKFA